MHVSGPCLKSTRAGAATKSIDKFSCSRSEDDHTVLEGILDPGTIFSPSHNGCWMLIKYKD